MATRRRPACSSARRLTARSCARSSACSRWFSSARPAVVHTESSSAPSSRTAGSWISAATDLAAADDLGDRAGARVSVGRRTGSPSTSTQPPSDSRNTSSRCGSLSARRSAARVRSGSALRSSDGDQLGRRRRPGPAACSAGRPGSPAAASRTAARTGRRRCRCRCWRRASPPTPAITITPVPYTGSSTRRLAGDARRQRLAVITIVIAISTRPIASEIASSAVTTACWWSTSSDVRGRPLVGVAVQPRLRERRRQQADADRVQVAGERRPTARGR